jgi:hypothetical protein
MIALYLGTIKKTFFYRSGINRKGDANPAHWPRLGTLLCTWIRAGNLGSRAGQPGPGVRLSQSVGQVGRWR